MVGKCYIHKCEDKEFESDQGKVIQFTSLQLATLDAEDNAGDMCTVTGVAGLIFEGRGDYEVRFRLQSREGKTLIRVVSIEKLDAF